MNPRVVALALLTACALALTGCAPAGEGSDPNNPNQLEAFTWWVSGAEKSSLDTLVAIYKAQHPEVEFIDASVAGDAGLNAKVALAARLDAGNPPDTFQAHAGAELIDYIEAGQVQDLSGFYAAADLNDVFPPSLIERLTLDKKIYSVPVDIHRANVVWANTAVLSAAGIDPAAQPADLDAWIADLQRLRDSGVQSPLSLGTGWTQVQLFENCLIADLGADGYNNLWAGYLKWDGPGVRNAVAHYERLLEFANPDFDALEWSESTQRVIDGEAGYTVMADWADAAFADSGMEFGIDYVAFPTPGTAAAFDFLADSFTLPVGAPHEQSARDWLDAISSAQGQRLFNQMRGSIPARVDVVAAEYGAYQQTAIRAFATDEIVSSLAHGAAARVSWSTDVSSAIQKFGRDRHPEALVTALVQASENACEEGAGPTGLSLCPNA